MKTKQQLLDLGIEITKDYQGIEMGVLENGIPFLTESGLARVVGVARSVIYDIRNEWEKSNNSEIISNDRISTIKESLYKYGYKEAKLYIETRKDNSRNYAYPDVVCMAILEYYAFDSQVIKVNKTAQDNYKTFARYGLAKFIYDALGYSPQSAWKHFQDRVSILHNSTPDGYFSIFQESAGMVVDLIQNGFPVSEKTIPDISIGKAWGDYWSSNNLSDENGARVGYKHNYPDYYPQAESNPQNAWAYPNASLHIFREWFKNIYLPTKYPKYVLSKAKLIKGGVDQAKQIASVFEAKALKDNNNR